MRSSLIIALRPRKGPHSWTRCIDKWEPFGGEGGIRTLDTLVNTAAYETAALSRSATSIEVLQRRGSTQAPCVLSTQSAHGNLTTSGVVAAKEWSADRPLVVGILEDISTR